MSTAQGGVWRVIAARLRGYLTSGLIVVIPVVLTGFVFVAAVDMVGETAAALLPITDRLEARLGIGAPVIGLVVVVLGTTMIGYVAKLTIGRRLVAFGEREVGRFPVIRSIYNAVKQLIVTIFEKSDSAFQKTCLIEYPHDGKWAVAFIAGDAHRELCQKTGERDLIAVYMPTTPNPITGFLLFVPARNVIPLTMDMEDAAKLVISAGLVEPGDREPGPRASSADT